MTGLSVISLSALVVGGAGGLGIWMLALHIIDQRRPTLSTRVAPWVSDISEQAHVVAVESLTVHSSRSASIRHRVSSALSSRLPSGLAGWLDGGSHTQVLLAQAGRSESLAQWRSAVIESGVLGGVVSMIGAVAGFALFHASLLAVIPLALTGIFGGIWLRRWMLERSARSRVALRLEELPALCELLAISLTAGEGFREALTRVSARGTGPLAEELRAVHRRAELGESLVTALSDLSTRLEIAPLSRTLDHIIAGIERGTPLTSVLRTQASEARAESGRRLQERASAREVVMLLPLVFLILPITIAFAVFPGLLVIQAGL